jgi:XRE family transcriptional regulator, regulator of sulfur utilization
VPTASVELAREVGVRVQRLRKARGLSLSGLASATGLGKGTLSEIERGLRNPTLETLFAITTALRAPLSTLLVDGPTESSPAAEAVGTGIDARLLDRHDGSEGTYEVYRLRIGIDDHRSEAHHTGVTETMTVLEGVASVGPEDAVRRLGPGETYQYDAATTHLYRAEGVTPATALLVMRYPRHS